MPRLPCSCKKLLNLQKIAKNLQVNEKQWKKKIAIFAKTEKIAKIVKFAKFVESVKSTKCISIGGGEGPNKNCDSVCKTANPITQKTGYNYAS